MWLPSTLSRKEHDWWFHCVGGRCRCCGPLVNAIQILLQATVGWHAGDRTIIPGRCVISRKSGRIAWEILEEEENQEWSQNGALGYTRWDRGFLRPTAICAGRDFTVLQVAFKPIKLFVQCWHLTVCTAASRDLLDQTPSSAIFAENTHERWGEVGKRERVLEGGDETTVSSG